ncbi:DUF6880 family protein [Xaviernesmea oryzae]|uniref:DUF6880 family protein n=1 Tax=Xaviernesmea oryzae TaxID=464029 RepID=UPI0008C521D6|nr:DUF6880 family protein [Xaviernesmea oryzae]SEL02117.1 hypothetical protein SAMN04487976_105155 [Xaviernesmea oryzae]
MARKPVVNSEALCKLGAEKLAALIVVQAESDQVFRRIVSAALAGAKGPEAVTKLIDQRLAALEKARSRVSWRRTKTFAQDLQSILRMIDGELAPLSAPLAVDRLLRFIATNGVVFERLEDGSGLIDDLYQNAVDALVPLTERLDEADRLLLPDRIMARLEDDEDNYLLLILTAIARHLPEAALLQWDRQLEGQTKEIRRRKGGRFEHEFFKSRLIDRLLTARQIIARARDDLDGLVALEAQKSPTLQDRLSVARMLYDAGRFQEALDWLRKPEDGRVRIMRREDLANGAGPIIAERLDRVALEANILTALGDKPAAQALRWTCFEETLEPEPLRGYIAALGDFEEFEALDKAFAFVSKVKSPYGALSFFLRWPRLDHAAALVLAHRGRWDGGFYELLASAAELLEESQPLASAVLYRALLDDILNKSRSAAYGHGARHLIALRHLDGVIPPEAYTQARMEPHAAYEAKLKQVHGRKYGFWPLLEGH